MTAARFVFLVLYALIALTGLVCAAAAEDTPFAIFGYGLILFGVINAYAIVGKAAVAAPPA